MALPYRNQVQGIERIVAGCGALALQHQVVAPVSGQRLFRQLEKNETILGETRALLTQYTAGNGTSSSIATWLLDNFYIIDEQLRKVCTKEMKQKLCRLPEIGEEEKVPRMYAILADAISSTDGQLTPVLLTDMINAYQQTSVLTLRELKATSAMLVIALLENLTRLAVRICIDVLQQKNKTVAENMRGAASNQRVADRISLQNNMSSLRLAGGSDWREYEIACSKVEAVLAKEKSGIYPGMDYSTRHAYGEVIELIAVQSGKPEIDIAALAVQLAGKNDQPQITAHAGYYIYGRGRRELEQLAGARIPLWEQVRRKAGTYPLLNYISIVALVAVSLTWLLWQQLVQEKHGWVAPGIVAICLLICASQIGIMIANWMAALLVRPLLLPRLDYAKEIPADARTLVVVPVIFSSEADMESLIDALEVRYLSNRCKHLHFSMLSDLPDAAEKTIKGDDRLVTLACEKIKSLNQKYATDGEDIFYLFHRPREWNTSENAWIGYERKRGKLCQLNDLLCENVTTPFSHIVGNLALLRTVKYVITLDADTQLPRDAAWKMIGTMAHPLNKAVYDTAKDRITQGYGVLQPRIGTYIPERHRSLYIRMQGSSTGIDPYTRVVSDLYQDIFGEGSFIGKGIYDVQVFQQVLHNRFPENRILSHDLLEGCYLRSGLVSDVQLYEEQPYGYYADTRRHHRWIRGDWQIANYLLPFVNTGNRGRVRNKLSSLSRWKIFDNLRRSLVPAALLTLLLLGWVVLEQPVWSSFAVLLFILFPCIMTLVRHFGAAPLKLFDWRHWYSAAKGTAISFIQSAYAILCLPYEAYYTMDAIGRTCWRTLVSKKHLLEWSHSGHKKHRQARSIAQTYGLMWPNLLAAVVPGMIVAVVWPQQFFLLMPLLVLWMVAPLITWYISRMVPDKPFSFSKEQHRYLRGQSRRIWSFFEDFVNQNDSWLPPDYSQEYPVTRVSHRTSPTNMGLAQLANLAASDFGYISVSEFIFRTGQTMQTMKKLERYKGHFYNWYDTHTLKPVKPYYVSTVDSGNLAALLMVLRQGILDMRKKPIADSSVLEALADTLHQVTNGNDAARSLRDRLEAAIAGKEFSLSLVYGLLCGLTGQTGDILLSAAKGDRESEDNRWLKAFSRQCRQKLDELDQLAPWLKDHVVPGKFSKLVFITGIPSLHELVNEGQEWLTLIRQLQGEENTTAEKEWLCHVETVLPNAVAAARTKVAQLNELADDCTVFYDIDFDFLYDRSRHLLSIGYNAETEKRDKGCYDLLASEARVAAYVGIAQGKIPQQSWFALGRPLVRDGSFYSLLSWSGSMFEYLMPLLVMPAYKDSLLYAMAVAAVQRQQEHGRKKGLPWGISECAYAEIDINLAYQYGPSGIAALGLQRDIDSSHVIAPYASMLGLLADPEAACTNLQHLSAIGMESKYGFYEAVDYTTSRLAKGKEWEIVRSSMLHHQGMSFLSLASVLLNKPMQKRFESDKQLRTGLVLLQEQMARDTAFPLQETIAVKHAESDSYKKEFLQQLPEAQITGPSSPVPQVQLLSNGRYHVMVTNAGGGYTRWKDLALTRWREDATLDNKGIFCYIKDTGTEQLLSATYQPVCQDTDAYLADFSGGVARVAHRCNGLSVATDIAVSPEDDAEIRRVGITNTTSEKKYIEITSYAEVVLAPQEDDLWHPAFSNLFLETSVDRDAKTIYCIRRSKSVQKQMPVMFHAVQVYGAMVTDVSYETDRLRFIGRGQSAARPKGVMTDGLSGSEGSVLDPAVAIKHCVLLEPGQSVTADIITGIAENKKICRQLSARFAKKSVADTTFTMAATYHRAVLKRIQATEYDVQLYRQLASFVLFATTWNAKEAGGREKTDSAALLNYAISGDIPVVLLRLTDPLNIELAEHLVKAHGYWQLHGVLADLVIWNESEDMYTQFLFNHIMEVVSAVAIQGSSCGIFVFNANELPATDKWLMKDKARLVIDDREGSLEQQIAQHNREKDSIKKSTPARPYQLQPVKALSLPALQFFNGTGGFSRDGREYLITAAAGQTTPLPWSNVLANPHFGTVITEAGQSYTWAVNAHEFRLTPWDNDPVTDSAGETYYIRDEEDGHYWSPVALPPANADAYVVRHGFGYSVFEHRHHGIRTEMWVYVDLNEPVKLVEIRFFNESKRQRQLSATGYIEWVLGGLRTQTASQIAVDKYEKEKMIVARNPYSKDFGKKHCFFAVDQGHVSCMTNRSQFIGRNGSLARPAMLSESFITDDDGALEDPCAVLHTAFTLDDNEMHRVVFMLGTGNSLVEVQQLADRFRAGNACRQSLQAIQKFWQDTVSAVQVKTPDPALNILANGWLLYQTLSSRLWARSGYYQSGGAYGFRDQLQDVLAFLHADPQLAKRQLLLCAAHQFREGDVLHWWHPPAGKGVRTRCSDDRLWLPFVLCQYIRHTGDAGILEMQVPFLEGGLLGAGEESSYGLFSHSTESASLYTHCVKAIQYDLDWGVHGLPLIGSGDWNDGMDQVGKEGKGESVWLAFFLYRVLIDFAELSQEYADHDIAFLCITKAEELRNNIEKNGWDGEWYRRAYFDNGEPLGSAQNDECSIDSVAQSWAVLSGAVGRARSTTALLSAYDQLVDKKSGIIQMLNPAFDKTTTSPGYIKGYLPGVRENGGQYTHAAIWLIMAFAKMGDRKKVHELVRMINPIWHASTAAGVATYKTEPYVIAGDVYSASQHKGRGGWSWYTGSAGWMYQLLINTYLGLTRENKVLRFSPVTPEHWKSVTIQYRYEKTIYHIEILTDSSRPSGIYLDKIRMPDNAIDLIDDGLDHSVVVNLRAAAAGIASAEEIITKTSV